MQQATYYNNLTNIARNRVNFDIKMIENSSDELDKEGIYFSFKKNEIDSHYLKLIVGPNDTPYEGGFYFFTCQYPDQYPFHPMKVKTETQGGNVRKHPNLYACGKCCFSFLGTWSGPPWTACHNAKTVAFSIRSVLTDNPLENEPGWENKKDHRHELYSRCIQFFNLKYAVCSIMEETPLKFNCFRDIMEKQFLNNYPRYLKNLETFAKSEGELLKSPVYGFSIKIQYDDVKQRLDKIYKSLIAKQSLSQLKVLNNDQCNVNNDKPTKVEQKLKEKQEMVNKKDIIELDGCPMNMNTSGTQSNTISPNAIKKHLKIIKNKVPQNNSLNQEKELVPNTEPNMVYSVDNYTFNTNTTVVNNTLEESNNIVIDTKKNNSRKAPNVPASNFDTGYILKSENDNKLYKVTLYSFKGNTSKRWVKCNDKN